MLFQLMFPRRLDLLFLKVILSQMYSELCSVQFSYIEHMCTIFPLNTDFLDVLFYYTHHQLKLMEYNFLTGTLRLAL